MGKTELLYELNYAKCQLDSFRTKLNTLKDKLSTVEMFSAQCASRIGSFEESMERRKTRLLRVDSLLASVKAAMKYREKMNDMLNGFEYTNTIAAIDQLQYSISLERRKIIENIQYVEDQISYYKSRVATLQYEYDNYSEEVEDGVQ